MKAIIIVSLLSLMVSCTSPGKETGKSGSEQSDAKDSSVTNCYRYANETDTVNLQLIRAGESVTGTLVYDFDEKDKNTGTINGFMKKNLLIAEYMFISEGMLSTRQVAFKLEGNSLIEGYGDSFSRNGKDYFKNVDSLSFRNSIKLTEISCE
jgi:hypothetical protein